MKNHTLKLLLTFLGLLFLTTARPSQFEEGNKSEIGDADYESSDDAASDEYLREDEATDEIPQNRNDVPEDQELTQNSKLEPSQQRSPDRGGFEEISGKTVPEGNRKREKIADKEHFKTDLDADEPNDEVNDEKIIPSDDRYKKNRELDDTNMKEKSLASDYGGETLFKIKPDGYNTDRNVYINDQEAGGQSRRMKEFQNSYELRSRDFNHRKSDLEIIRNRRQAPNLETIDVNSTPSQKDDMESKNENSESSIVKNIKKLSEQDLEELLNSLPEDKKAILKKIMEKREITKKAGAVEENYLDGGQAETSKIEGGYLIDSTTNSESSFSSSTDSTDLNKHTESGDVENTKNSENENVPGKSETKSQLFSSKDQNLNVGIETKNSNSNIKSDTTIILKDEESVKTENKREINKVDYINEDTLLENSEKNNEDVDLKDDLCFENEETPDQKEGESKANSDTQKRETSADNPSEMRNSIQSLEESFPSDSTGESALSPLIRVKRTEKDHSNNKRNVNIPSNVKVPFFPGVESGGTENDERSEIEDYGFFDRTSNYAKNDQNSKLEERLSQETSGVDGRDLKFNPMEQTGKEINADSGKTCLGSDTDSVLSSVEGVDENLMYNSGTRNKRTEEISDIDNADGVQLSRSGQTTGPLDASYAVSDNSINQPQYREEESFGSLSHNYEGENSRFKRIRQIKQAPIPQDYST